MNLFERPHLYHKQLSGATDGLKWLFTCDTQYMVTKDQAGNKQLKTIADILFTEFKQSGNPDVGILDHARDDKKTTTEQAKCLP